MPKELGEFLWFRKLLSKIRLAPNIEMNLLCNINALIITTVHYMIVLSTLTRTKHIEMNFRHTVKLKFEKKNFKLFFIRFFFFGVISFTRLEDQLANILTKKGSSKAFIVH